MGDFMSGLTDLLGGWNAVRRIDKEGFDWREKAAQEEAARQQQQQQWQQGNEDWATKAATEASLGAEEGEDISGLIADQKNKARILARAKGAGLQAKSSIEAQRGFTAENVANIRVEAQKAALRNTQEFQRAMQEERIAAQREGRKENEENAWKRLGFAQQQANYRANIGTVQPILDESGRVTDWYNTRPGPGGTVRPVEGPVGGRRSPPPATFVESQNQAVGDLATIDYVKKNFKPDWVGPIAYAQYEAQSRLPGVPEPDPVKSEFYAATARLRNAGIRAITGAQMSEYEVPRLSLELPQPWDKPGVYRAKLSVLEHRTNILAQVRDGRMTKEQAIQEINSVGPEDFLNPADGRAPVGRPTPPAGPAPTGTPQPKSKAEYDALPSGTVFIDPNGVRRTKP